jgi:hypothetical protein
MTVSKRYPNRFTLLAMVVLMVGAMMVAATPTRQARADGFGARWDGYYPWQVSGCLAGNVRAGNGTRNPVVSLWSTSGTYYGWAEQRYGTRGDCNGYQWIRLHVTNTIPLYAYANNYFYASFQERGGRQAYLPDGSRYYSYLYLYPNNPDRPYYDMQIMQVWNYQACATSWTWLPGGRDRVIFGHGGVESNDDGLGNWCA